uniref:Tc1-like transposase DDE domain-containing protein n=1 Tax=Plectus sambesii TaxID=2011161 RepID=A0A914UM85_9BILA
MLYDEIIRPLCHEHKKYAVDELDRQHNVIILSLPPYHCKLNPIELLWAKVKGDLRKRNRIENKLSEVVNIFRDVFLEITVNSCSSIYSRTDVGETDDENVMPNPTEHGRKSRYNLRSLSSRRSSPNDDVTQELMKLPKKVRQFKSQATLSEGSEDESTRLRRRSVNAVACKGSNVTRSSSPPALTRRCMASASSSVVSSSRMSQQANKTKRRTTFRGVESEVEDKTRDGNNRKSPRRSSRRLTMIK